MKSTRFFEFFPPPNFLTMPAIGLSVESDVLRVVSFETKHGFEVLKIAKEYILEPGVITAGEIVKPEKLVSVLKKIRSEHGAHFVRVALPEEKAYIYETIIPVPEEGDLKDSVEFSLDQNIPIPAAETVFGFVVTDEPFSNNGVESVRVVVSAYPRETVEMWVDLLKQAGTMPLFLTPESQALSRSLVANGDNSTVMIVHFLKDKTVIVIVSAGLVRFTTTVTISPENSEKALEAHVGDKISESAEILSVRDEVKKVFSYWSSRQVTKTEKKLGSIKSLIVSGRVTGMNDVAEYLGKHIGAPAFLGNVWQNAFSLDIFVPDLPFEEALRFSATVGVALPN